MPNSGNLAADIRRTAFFLVGPTATGKTAVGHILAEKLSLPILSADSMMVYRGMNIGTAKPTPEEISKFDYAGLDLTDPERLEIAIDAVPGVVENGIFARRRADVVLVGAPQGVRVLRS